MSCVLKVGVPPDYEYGGSTDPDVPDLAHQGNFTLANSGGELILKKVPL